MTKDNLNKICGNYKNTYTIQQLKKISKNLPNNNKRYKDTWIKSICKNYKTMLKRH